MADKLSSPLILKYQRDYEDKPKSRVFVPLAESYRKVGMVDKAVEILRKGLEFHPHYVTAHVVLGNCYVDNRNYEKALRVLKPVAEDGSENLKLLNLLAICHRELGDLKEAKKYYKYILFFNPNDTVAAESLAKIDSQVPDVIMDDGVAELHENRFNANIESEVYKDADEWMRVDGRLDPPGTGSLEKDEDSDWEVGDINSIRKEFKEELPQEVSLELVNVYQSQGLHDRALKILEEYIKNDPSNREFLEKKKHLILLLEKKAGNIELATLDQLPDDGSSLPASENKKGSTIAELEDFKDIEKMTEVEELPVKAEESPSINMKKRRLEGLLSGLKKRAVQKQKSTNFL